MLGYFLGPLMRLASLADEVLDGLLAALKSIPLPFMDKVVGAVTKLWDDLVAWFDELIAWVRKKLDGEPDAPKKVPDEDAPDGKSRNGVDEENLRPRRRRAVRHTFQKHPSTTTEVYAPPTKSAPNWPCVDRRASTWGSTSTVSDLGR